MDYWYSEEEIDAQKGKGPKREQWTSNWTYILAATGAAIGLGNFWRFPYLTAKHGGAFFFFPWLSCLFFLGIPYMILELGLG